jgi:hypothetical protein
MVHSGLLLFFQDQNGERWSINTGINTSGITDAVKRQKVSGHVKGGGGDIAEAVTQRQQEAPSRRRRRRG